MTRRKGTITLPVRGSRNISVDIYTWLRGEDEQFHKIGFSNGVPIVERIGDRVIELIDTEVNHYSNLQHNIKEI